VEKDYAELKATLSEHMESHEGPEHGSRVGSRRMQTDGGNLHPHAELHADPVYIIKPNVTRITTAVRDGSTGRRRAQAGDGYGEGTCSDLESRSAEVTLVCCDDPEEDCTGGYPHSCNADCAATFLSFWDDCRSALGKSSQHFEPAVELCTASSGTSGTSRPSLAEQLNLQCTDGTAAAECVPECSEGYHGYLMLLNIDGDDSKLSCELQHGYYSWVGAAVCTSNLTKFTTCFPPFGHLFLTSLPPIGVPQTEGGYLGSDFEAFFSAVVSGAAGVYVGVLLENAGVNTDLVVRPGQRVSVSGDASLPQPPVWGDGGFTVQHRGSLELHFVALGTSADILAVTGGLLSLSDMVVDADVMEGTLNHMDDADSSVQLFNVIMPDFPERGAGMGTAIRDVAGGPLMFEPANLEQWFLGQVRCLCCVAFVSDGWCWSWCATSLLLLQCFVSQGHAR
jgi:hypothetical protein